MLGWEQVFLSGAKCSVSLEEEEKIKEGFLEEGAAGVSHPEERHRLVLPGASSEHLVISSSRQLSDGSHYYTHLADEDTEVQSG